MNTYHILNGDALKDQFPAAIEGEIIVTREAMVDGPVQAKPLDELFQLREKYMLETYGLNDYAEITIPEISRITDIKGGEVNLWFEDDLFCQINLWFVCNLIYQKDIQVYLVRPNTSLEYGFAGLNKEGLAKAHLEKQQMTRINVNQFALLWFGYRTNDIERLLKLGVQVHANFPFVMKAIEAHFDRLPDGSTPGLPERLIRQIIKEKATQDFGIVFKEFNRRAPIYGYGDLQVRRIFDQVLNDRL